ncbi:sugar kinase [Terribacillus saccharophilus]|uniref:sugar kinase n=1 Tax=Terribacillus saccharophilus TaxID=361277 RepID=UPI0039823727
MDVVTFGESMVLFTPATEGTSLQFSHSFEKTIGGSESNVAIALSRLGVQVGWISRLGDDDFGRYILHYVRGEGIDTRQVVLDANKQTGVFFKERVNETDSKVFYYRKDSAASFLSPDDLSASYIGSAKFLHLTGITPALSESCRQATHHALRLAKKYKVTTVFDPNIRLKLWSEDEARKELLSIASQCDIVMPGLEEGSLLTEEQHPEKIAQVLIRNGAKLVVIKLGEAGAFYSDGTHAETIPGYPVDRIVDSVGAGDGFMAGFLTGLLRKWDYRKSIQLANRIGAFALTVKGDVEGYPYWSSVDDVALIRKEIYR